MNFSSNNPDLGPLKIRRLDHIGHAVKSLSAGISRFQALFGATLELKEHLPEHAVEAAFLRYGDTSVELIAPLPGNTTLEKFLNRRGEGLHHICFEVDSVAEELKRLEAQGVRLIDSVPRPGARGTEIAFIHPQDLFGVLFELCSYPNKHAS